MARKLAKTDGYAVLVRKIRSELGKLELLLKRQTVVSYWNIGRYISGHLLENKDRAGYGDHLYERLSKDVDRDEDTLSRAVRFYRAYPISATWRKLGWSHYRALLVIKGESERKKIEHLAIKNDWDCRELAKYIKDLRRKETQLQRPKIIPQLLFTYGRLNTYRVLKSENLPPWRKPQLLIDLGFQLRRQFPEGRKFQLKEGDCVEVRPQGSSYDIAKITISEDEMFTYAASVEKVIDGDTLWTLIDCGFDFFIRQKLRLRGIDCPELPTPEGERAKRFVQNKLRTCKFIIIKTYRDKTDKYDRYLSDVFYLKDESNPQKVLEQGTFLNQQLLDLGLAKIAG
ncbi:MAG: thermonuclease family protein [Candidatus Omnitrophica bacterium]|nr:thermonuclease family protein [Candidatus Omnitrophota bacterium]